VRLLEVILILSLTCWRFESQANGLLVFNDYGKERLYIAYDLNDLNEKHEVPISTKHRLQKKISGVLPLDSMKCTTQKKDGRSIEI